MYLKVARCIAKQQICIAVRFFFFFGECCLYVFPWFSVVLSLSASLLFLYPFWIVSLLLALLSVSLLCCQPANSHLIFSSCAPSWSQWLSIEDPWSTFADSFIELPSVWHPLFACTYVQTPQSGMHILPHTLFSVLPNSKYQSLSFSYSHISIPANSSNIISC